MTWNFEGVEYNETPSDFIGFVYIIIHRESGAFYIGQKLFWFKAFRMVNKKKKRVLKESDWRNYWGSSDKFKTFVKEKGKDEFNRIILHLCPTKGTMNYKELDEQVKRDALIADNCFNGIIQTRIGYKQLGRLNEVKSNSTL